MSKTYKKPFFHMQFPNFLSENQYKKLYQIYSKFQFKQKTSDLFHFFQTHQLNKQKSIQFFTANLTKVFSKLSTPQQLKNSFYSVFASYYFPGDYLLCHDDIIEDRKYAFSYYLEDFDFGGQLVLFNNVPDKVEKEIKVRKNTLVIFQVCDQSYHQVAYCWGGNGRKAVTGWFNVKGQGAKRVQKSLDKFKPTIIKNALNFPLDQNHVEQQYFQMMDIDYQFNIKKQTLQGPFYSKRVHRLQLQPAVVFEVPGYTLLSSDFYKFAQGDYLLLNDPVNTIENGQDVLDIFITHLGENYETNDQNMLVKIVEQDGSLSGIPQIHDSLFVVKRGKKQYYIERNNQEFLLGHFIYVKSKPVNKKSSKTQVKHSEQKISSKKVNKTQSRSNKSTKLKKITKSTPKSSLKQQKQTTNLTKNKLQNKSKNKIKK